MANDVGHQPIYRKSLVDKYLERYIESHQRDAVIIYRGLWKFELPPVVYQGWARIHRLASAVQMGFGDEPQYMVSGTISLPMQDESGADVIIQVDDHVRVTSHWDRLMIGRLFRVMHVDVAGQFHNTVSLSVVGSEDSPTTQRVIAP